MERKQAGLKTELEIDSQIENQRKLFYSNLLDKKRSIKRKWLEVGSISNEQLIATLPYRAMLNKSDDVIEEWINSDIPEYRNPVGFSEKVDREDIKLENAITTRITKIETSKNLSEDLIPNLVKDS